MEGLGGVESVTVGCPHLVGVSVLLGGPALIGVMLRCPSGAAERSECAGSRGVRSRGVERG